MSQLTLGDMKKVIEGQIPSFTPVVYVQVPIRGEDGKLRHETRRALAIINGDPKKEFAVYIVASEDEVTQQSESEQQRPAPAKRRRVWPF